jgi:hypothetical protein
MQNMFFLLAASDIAICHLFYQQKSWFDITIAVSVRWQTTNFFNNERTQYLSATETDIPSM